MRSLTGSAVDAGAFSGSSADDRLPGRRSAENGLDTSRQKHEHRISSLMRGVFRKTFRRRSGERHPRPWARNPWTRTVTGAPPAGYDPAARSSLTDEGISQGKPSAQSAARADKMPWWSAER